MPELPEVETIRAGLEPHLLGQKITGITVLRPSQLRDISPEELSTQLIGKTINRLSRRGKYLLFYCSSELILVVHLRMTGQLLYYSAGKPAMVSYQADHILRTSGRASFSMYGPWVKSHC